MNILIQIDIFFFRLINNLPHPLPLDDFFSILSGAGKSGLIWIVITIIFLVSAEIKDRKVLPAVFLALISSYILVEAAFKSIFHRLRPEFVLANVTVVTDRASSFSFPSSHATIAFACAYILSQKHKKLRWLYFTLAILISFSRIYLGKHYPFDVLAGSVLGHLIGILSLRIVKFAAKVIKIKRK